MSPETARNYIENIRECCDDDERAHALEDDSREHFLKACAGGAFEDVSEAREVARILLESNKISFHRWYA